jgi:hypothetical protein
MIEINYKKKKSLNLCTVKLYCGVQMRCYANTSKQKNETTAGPMQWGGKHTSIKKELPLEMVFSAWSVQRGCKEDIWGVPVS